MSTYYDINISHTVHSEIWDAIFDLIKYKDNRWEIIELVHLLDYWEELKEEASAKNNKEFQRWREEQKMLEKNEVKDIFLFHNIKSILDKNSIELDVESEFHLICDLAKIFEEEWDSRLQNK